MKHTTGQGQIIKSDIIIFDCEGLISFKFIREDE